LLPISAERPVESGVYVHNGVLHDGRGGSAREIADVSRLEALPGRHNWQNAAAAYAAVTALGVPVEAAVGALASYPGLAHRQQRVGALGRVTFVNDSKATNVDAVVRALACYDRIYWIAGGQAKGESLTPLFAHLHRVARAFLIGSAAPAFAEALGSRVPTTIAGDLATAVRRAAANAATDGQRSVVLLSPACASFDQFTDFEARGRAFISAVSQLPAFEPAATRTAANAA
jgi:UDP-N-acetylmuramoylalanine--D-glutamate ligase